MKKISIVVLALIFLITGVFKGCNDTVVEEDTQQTTVQINPLPESVNNNEINVRLYFGYHEYDLLVGETRKIKVPVNESIEISILQELIKEGPSATKIDFTQVINSNTTILKAEQEGQILTVTLSEEFLDPPDGSEVDYQNEDEVSYEKTRKYLAVYSIVNTLIEQGNAARVRILIEEDDRGIGRPITMMEAGIDGVGDAEPFERLGSIELNGENTMSEILSAIETREWSTVYDYIAYKDSLGQDKPSLEDFRNFAEAAKFSISSPEVLGGTLSPDYVSNIIMVSYELKQQDGEVQVFSNVPIKLVQENDVWKMTYNVFEDTFMN